MDAQALIDSGEESLSALSTQLVSLGYLSRPLDLRTLFLAPALPPDPSSKALKRHHDLLVLQARAREQIAKCLWGMLEQRQSERGQMEGLLAGEARASEDAERERKGRERAEREREAMGRELEAERARVKEVETMLKAEQERHRHAREELGKTKNALQFVKTQATHDQKRRETEVQALHQRLQKLTTTPSSSSSSDSAFTRFVVLNSSASSPSASSPLSATFGTGAGGRTSRLGGRSPTPSQQQPAPASAALEAELDLLRSSLDECVGARTALEGENADLRAFVGEVGEWAEGMLEVPELVGVRKDGEEGAEMRGVLEGDGDESYLVPTPHLALPIPAITAPLHRKLYAIRLGLLSLASSSSSALSALREELEHELERLHEEVEEEQRRREEAEGERDDAREKVEAGERVVREWAERAEREAQKAKGDESDDDLPPEIEASLALDKQKRLARKASKHAPSTSSSTAAPPSPSSSRPSIPSAHVSAFLSELGLDTPGLPASSSGEKAPLKADRVGAAAITSARERELAQSQSQGQKDARRERVRPSLARAPRSETDKASEKAKEKEGAMLPPPAPVRRVSSSSRPLRAEREKEPQPQPQTAREQPSSTLQEILALAASPPVASEPLLSDRARAQAQPVLGASRAANGAPASGGTSEEERVRAKKAALLAKARSGRA